MYKRLATRRLAFVACLLTLVGLGLYLPSTGLFGEQAKASAAVATGDLIFERDTSGGPGSTWLMSQHGTTTQAFASVSGANLQEPAVSPNGAKVAFQCGECEGIANNPEIWTMNSDGSGMSLLVTGTNSSYWSPIWSPDSSQIAYGASTPNGFFIYKINADGTNATQLTTGGSEENPIWAGNGKIAYIVMSGSGSGTWVMNSDGSNKVQIASSAYTDDDWSSDSTRLYVNSNDANYNSQLQYLTSTNGFTSSAGTVVHAITTDPANHIAAKVSADGTKMYYQTFTSQGCYRIFSVPVTGGTPTIVTTPPDCANAGGSGDTYMSVVKNAYPAAQPSNSTVALATPSPHDAPYTRAITIGLSATGNKEFDYGWSTSSTIAPTANLQKTSDMVNRKGTLNYLGIYSGTGTTWNGGTQPDADWYLWVRSVTTANVNNAWGTPLKVHTPKAPIWDAIGDSYSSGHHQTADEPLCPNADDAPWYNPTGPACATEGAPHVIPNDPTYSWTHQALISENTSTHAPAAWAMTLDLIAYSGAQTASFGAYGTTPGTDAWSTGTTQSGIVRGDLYSRYYSWNVVSMTGGADDTTWTSVMSAFYQKHVLSESPAPWNVTTSNPSQDCPDSQSVFAFLQSQALDGQTYDTHIKANLQGVVTVATAVSPGVRILNIGYPYIVDSTNACSGITGAWHGSKSVIDELNTDHTSVTGTNVHYINLTATGSFGANPVGSNLLQLRRFYGYPHPVDAGQAMIATTTLSNLNGTW